ncbi:hypothetical protein QBC47DRAFT_306091 [Echria macrotheca]|uniref:Galactose oxidase n=1 Tax=Echria macrotheca TaxID=438768 RepID=A0AAJ0B5M8_9PEZI|nr:hypothetical protein QBC47DRAFT_306091 [Echria macrotheca]
MLSALISVEAALPYMPTTILLSKNGISTAEGNTAYIFSPNSASVDLLAVNVSSKLSAASLKPETLASNLPFLASHKNVAFTPTAFDNGTLAVFAGDCSVATSASLWTWSGGNTKSWSRHGTAPSKNWDYGQGGPYFLGGGLSFSAQLAPEISDPIVYIYGGMCPFSNATASSSQSMATYSNRMLKIAPPRSSTDASYSVSYATSTGPPIAEAGFTFTELTPSLSNRSGIITQQTSHVLLGGHTQGAFINMSTAAIWSLPEETWNFVSIAAPAPVGKTDLLAKDTSTPNIDARSGHTAVLSEDGTSLAILGGWVGDLTQPAEPQLAIIKIGAAYGDWQWSVPAAQPSGRGIYGHGAVLLPGNVMMVYGGYEISSKSRRRATSPTKMFFNMTSLSWTDEYVNPNIAQHGSVTPSPSSPTSGTGSTGGAGGSFTQSAEQSSGGGSTSNNQLGLGLGLGLGIPLLAIIAGIVVCIYRRRARRRAQRDEAIRGLAQGMGGPLHHEMMENRGDDGIFPWDADSARDWYTGGHDPYIQGRRSLGYETLRGGGNTRSGPLYMPPPMASSSGRPRAARGLYQPSTSLDGRGTYDFTPLRIPMKNEIHPIYEDDEEEEDGDLGVHSPSRMVPDEEDPFATPTNPNTPTGGYFPPAAASSGSDRSASPEQKSRQDAEVQGWVSDVDAADAVLTAKISRHGSTTTTPPRFANNPSPLLPPPAAGRLSPHRRNSSRSGAVGAAIDAEEGRTGSNLSDKSAFSFVAGAERVTTGTRPQSSPGRPATGKSGSSTSAGSFSTAKSTFAALQAEGPSLLLHGGFSGDTDAEEAMEQDYINVPGSPSKSKPRRSWLGNLKRVFSGGTPSDGGGSSGGREDSPTRESLLDNSDYEPRLVGMGPNGMLLTRRKQGRAAWDAVGDGDREKDEEWDVERAVEQRLVQVMFTVPKERLRVVNAEIEKEEEAVIVTPGGEGDYEDDWDEDSNLDRRRRVEIRGGSSTSQQQQQQAMAERAAGALLFRDNNHRTMEEEGMDITEEKGKHGEEQDDVRLELPPMAGGGGGISPSPSLRTASITTATLIHLAEEVKMERPRTRVLEMVESIESKSSRENSPAGSPSRSVAGSNR